MVLSKHPLDTRVRELDRRGIAEAIRLAIIGELDAINLYLQMASVVKDPLVKKVLEDIAYEEKIHVGELLEILKIIDEEQEKALVHGRREVEDLRKTL